MELWREIRRCQLKHTRNLRVKYKCSWGIYRFITDYVPFFTKYLSYPTQNLRIQILHSKYYKYLPQLCQCWKSILLYLFIFISGRIFSHKSSVPGGRSSSRPRWCSCRRAGSRHCWWRTRPCPWRRWQQSRSFGPNCLTETPISDCSPRKLSPERYKVNMFKFQSFAGKMIRNLALNFQTTFAGFIWAIIVIVVGIKFSKLTEYCCEMGDDIIYIVSKNRVVIDLLEEVCSHRTARDSWPPRSPSCWRWWGCRTHSPGCCPRYRSGWNWWWSWEKSNWVTTNYLWSTSTNNCAKCFTWFWLLWKWMKDLTVTAIVQ